VVKMVEMEAVSGSSPIVCQPYRLTRNGGNGSGGVRMAKSPIVYQLYEGRATGNEATPGGAIGQSAHCVSTPGGEA
jgi:hypothetical protein